MRKLLRIFLLVAALVTVLCVSAMAEGEPTVAGLYNFQSTVTGAVKITPMTADSETAITPNDGFYENAARFDVTYTNVDIQAGEQYLLLVCSGTGAPSESNIVYINQKASVAGKVEFTGLDRAYPSSLGKGDYRIYVVGAHSAYTQATPTAEFDYHVPYKLGDVNDDGSVTTGDAVEILQTVVGKKTLNDTQKMAADVDGNGSVTTGDAVYILQFVVGKPVPYNLSND